MRRSFPLVLRREFKRSFSTSTGPAHHLYSWGTGDDGQLGHNSIIKAGISNTYVELNPKEIETFPQDSTFIDISCGLNHSAAVTSNGEVYTWGNAEHGKLGHSTMTETAKEKGHKICMTPTKVKIDEQIKQIVCGEFHSAALSLSGNVYTWGWGGSTFSGIGCLGHGNTESLTTPKKVAFPDENIKLKYISSGKKHMAAVGEGGEVWSWGHGEYGKNGNGGNQDQLSPELIEFFIDCDLSIKSISCGHNFTLALTEEGQIYAWGSNDQCQLGLGGGFVVDMFAFENFPKIVDAIENENIIHINAGQNHAIAINDKGELYIWGMKMWMEPHKLSGLEEHNLVSGDCGTNFTVVLNDAGQMFSWGQGMRMLNAGCLGQGHTKRIIQPQLIESMQNIPIQKVECGQRHVLAMSGLPPV